MPSSPVTTSSAYSLAVPLHRRLLFVAADIKLSHSIFALPFALLATFLAAGAAGRSPTWSELALIVLCMVLARTVAMTINRWADRRFDADNPRTAGRAIPSGRLSASFVLGTAIACSAAFIAASGGFYALNSNPWPVLLSPIVLLWVAGYSFTKRFTWLCHLFLGSALAISPVAAAIAINPAYLQQPEVHLLLSAVLCWVAGFDVIYALQDVQIDRQFGLHSMPSRLGIEPALWISRSLHAVSLASLIALAYTSPQLHVGFAMGVTIVAVLLLLEHALVWRSEQRHIHMAFFTVNGVISLLLGTLGIIDVLRSL